MTDKVERRLAAVLSADVVGYSRLMKADETGTLARLEALRRDLIDPKIAEHRGRTVKLIRRGAATRPRFDTLLRSVGPQRRSFDAPCIAVLHRRSGRFLDWERLRIDEAVEHVLGQPRDVVVTGDETENTAPPFGVSKKHRSPRTNSFS